MQSPKQRVEKQFESREKLAEAVVQLLAEIGSVVGKDEKGALARVANQKLLRLHQVATEIKAKFQTRSNLINEILRLRVPNAQKVDEDYKKKLEGEPTASGAQREPARVKQLWDTYRTLQRRSKRQTSK